jgi:UTP--glucose-1-phosphate uridylyltransferase
MSSLRVKKAVIPAAGWGTRLFPVTKTIPKEMLPILDVPVIHYIVEEAVLSGIEEIVLVSSIHKQVLERYFHLNPDLEGFLELQHKQELAECSRALSRLCKIQVVHQSFPRGLGDALLCAEPWLAKEPFAILLPDDLVDAKDIPCTKQLMDIFETYQISTVALMPVQQECVSKYGMVGGEAVEAKVMKLTRLVEKPLLHQSPSLLGIFGRYVLTPKIFESLRSLKPGKLGELQLTDALQKLALQEGLLGYLFEGTRYDTGDCLGVMEANIAFGLKRPSIASQVRTILKRQLDQK